MRHSKGHDGGRQPSGVRVACSNVKAVKPERALSQDRWRSLEWRLRPRGGDLPAPTHRMERARTAIA